MGLRVGSPENPTKDRLSAESYLGGVYVENVEEWCKNIKPGQGTAFGGIVRPLDELPKDIKKWAEEAERIIYIRRNGSLQSFL